MKLTRPYRVAYLVSHPIQYQAPLLRFVSSQPEIELKTFFLSDFSMRSYQDEGFGGTVTWDVPLTEGYQHDFLPAYGSTDPVNALRPLSRGLRWRLKSGGFDALWMHGYAHNVNLRALALAKMLGIKVLLRAESQMDSALRARGTVQLKEALLRYIFNRADGFLSIGSPNREYYRHYGVPNERIFSMPYAVDNAFFQARVAAAQPRREILRAELGLEPDRPVILFASKFIARKRAGDLIEAYARLSPDGKREPLPYLLFIGDGEQGHMLGANADKLGWSSIKFLGFKNQTELPAFYDLCDVFVLPSEREPWGLVVNEVMNAGKPLIVTEGVGSAPDLVKEGKNGFVVPVGDVHLLGEHLRKITSDPECARRMGQESLRIINGWSFQQDLEGLLAALEYTIGAREL